MKKVLKWIGIIFIALIVIGFISGGGDEKNDSSSTEQTVATEESNEAAEPTPTEAPEEVVAVDLAEFVGEFDDNQLAAETKYEKQLIQTTGYIDNISEDIMGKYYVILHPSNDEYYYGTALQCYFENKEDLVDLKNGEQVTLKGRVDNQMMNVLVKDCQVIE